MLGAAVVLTEAATSLPPSMRTWHIHPQATEEATVTARDGVLLRAAVFVPKTQTPRGAVIVLHGVGDSGYSMAGFGHLLNAQGYIVLTPDSRAHGGSGGDRITYGLLERYDVTAWLDWLDTRFHPPAFYGYGASLGGAILLQSLSVEPRLRAVVAECPFSDFHNVAYDRLAGLLPTPRLGFAPVVEPALVYARLRYGINLYEASPIDSVRRSRTPVLLIHGTADTNIPIEHSRRLHDASPSTTGLWEIPGAGHVAAWSTAGTQFEQRVVNWFANH